MYHYINQSSNDPSIYDIFVLKLLYYDGEYGNIMKKNCNNFGMTDTDINMYYDLFEKIYLNEFN